MMSHRAIAPVVDGRSAHRRLACLRSSPLPITGTVVFAVTLLALGLSSASSPAVRADGEPSSGLKGRASGADVPSDFLAAVRRTQKEQHDRMTKLANQLIKDAEVPHPVEAMLATRSLKIDSAKAGLRSAELAREAAEIALAEFEKGRVQEETHAEEELKVAQRHLQRLRRRSPQSKERRTRIEQASKDSNIDVAPLVIAELEEKKALFEAELAESELKALVNTTNPARLQGLRSNVDRATSAEQVARAQIQYEQTILTNLQQMVKARDVAAKAKKAPNPHHRQALAALERAIAVEAQLRPKVQQLTNDGKPSDTLRQQIQDLTTQLQALIDHAEIERSATQFDELKKRIIPAASR